jgi:hypothetical protein
MSDLSNHRKKWTVKEVKQLMKEIRTMDIQNIAKIHKRTYSGIYFKLVREAVNIAEEDPNIKLTELCDIVKLQPAELLAGFKKIKYDFNDYNSSDSDTSSEYSKDSDDSDYSDDSEDSDNSSISSYNSNNKISNNTIEDKKTMVYFSNMTSYCIIMINLLGIAYFLYTEHIRLYIIKTISNNIEDKKLMVYFSNSAVYSTIMIYLLTIGYYLYKQYIKL